MNENQIKLIRESWDYVVTNVDGAGMIFYDRLFEVAPEVKPLFKGDIKNQSKKLITMISFAIGKLDQLDSVVKDIEDLGRRHGKYNVRQEHYLVVGQALLWTLEKGASEIWTEEHKEAWSVLYGVLSATMIRGEGAAVL